MTKIHFSRLTGSKYALLQKRIDLWQKQINNNLQKLCACLYLPSRLHIKFKMLEDAFGQASLTNEKFEIEIDPRQTRKQFYDTLLHELVHVEQFYRKDLKIDGRGNSFKWKNKIVNDIDYINCPWEQEAVHRAKILVKMIFQK